MTNEPSEAAKRRAQELALAVAKERGKEKDQATDWMMALEGVLQEHSDVAKRVQHALRNEIGTEAPELDALILPDDPDPLEEAVKAACAQSEPIIGRRPKSQADRLREELAKRGLQIVEASDTPKSPQDAR